MKIKFYCIPVLLLLVANTKLVFAQKKMQTNIEMFRGDPQLTGISNQSPVYKLNGIKKH